jgi:hypothetical protein
MFKVQKEEVALDKLVQHLPKRKLFAPHELQQPNREKEKVVFSFTE